MPELQSGCMQAKPGRFYLIISDFSTIELIAKNRAADGI
jgi:hypothetical protein